MSRWKEISANATHTSVDTPNPNFSKTVTTPSVATELAAVVGNILSLANKPGVTSNLKQLEISARSTYRILYLDQEGNGVQLNTGSLDSSKIDALIAAVNAAPEVEE